MKISQLLLIFTMLFLISGCYAEITGTVIDAETGEPIEGAVILVEWTKKHGLGLTYTESYKVIEAVTDKDGKVTISGVFSPFVRPPSVTVYKKGYAAWNNQYIFPTWERRKDFKYQDETVIRLEQFKKEFSHYDHVSFISSGAVSGSGGKLLEDAYLWERILAQQEIERRKKENKGR